MQCFKREIIVTNYPTLNDKCLLPRTCLASFSFIFIFTISNNELLVLIHI